MATMNEKMTNVKALAYVLDNFGAVLPADVAEKLTKMQEQTAKHNTGKKSKTVSLTDGVAEKVLAMMVAGKAYQLADMVGFECFAKHPKTGKVYSPNQIAPVLTTLVNDGLVEKNKVKGKMTYTLIVQGEVNPEENADDDNSDEDADDDNNQMTDWEANTMY